MEIFKQKNIEYINVSHSVGKHGNNNPDDVMLVQALLKVVEDNHLGGIPKQKRPYPTGTFTSETSDLIRKFQNAQRKVYANGQHTFRDGIVNKAVGSIFVNGTKRPRTIIALNDAAIESMLLNNFGEDSLRALLVNYFPCLRQAFSKLDFSDVIDL
jgi:hypothetical protein